MAKLRSPIRQILSGALTKQVNPERKYSTAKTTYVDYQCRWVLRKKSPITDRRSPAQLAVRLAYCVCDYYLRTATGGQKVTWKRYYWSERNLGRTRIENPRITKKSKTSGREHHMGYRAYFFKRCLGWDFLDFFYNWLKSKWTIHRISFGLGVMNINASIVNRDDVRVPYELREYKLERVRF